MEREARFARRTRTARLYWWPAELTPYIRVNVMLRTVIAHTVVSSTGLDAGTGIQSNGGRSRPLYGAAWLQTTKSANGT